MSRIVALGACLLVATAGLAAAETTNKPLVYVGLPPARWLVQLVFTGQED